MIAGIGDFEPYLRKCATDVEDVLFVGFVNSLLVKKALYGNCLSVVVPSLYETFPMVVLEAMACSRPVIGCNVGGFPLLIKHNKNGFLAKPQNPKSLAKYIGILYENRDLVKSMGSFGRKLVEKKFTADKMVDETLKVYKSC